ncbi:molybdopterin cofactor-binding domain-containing protein [Deinococcus aquaticus]|uniref:molybdopterin cofactor-binding domain-containing protein n=1 Tax=Deinococcus aquaticus TaxID=328692 RepID=UPI00361B1861
MYPFGTHIAVVEIDTDTGHVKLRNYGCIDDCGPLINPLIAEGQVHGGITQGMGQALLEDAAYDEDGNLLAGTYMEYAMPRADDVPTFQLGHTVTPSPHNPWASRASARPAPSPAPPPSPTPSWTPCGTSAASRTSTCPTPPRKSGRPSATPAATSHRPPTTEPLMGEG